VVGEASTSGYRFILRSFQAKVGDIVATRIDVPVAPDGRCSKATVWGRIVGINRFNPFFPAEAAQELADQNIRFLDTVLSSSRDDLEAEVLILGTTLGDDPGSAQLSPLTYPVKPSADVLYPQAEAVRRLLTGDNSVTTDVPKLHIGSLIARDDVDVSLLARQVVSRHLAILAMTGGGKTVAARRIIRELIDLRYPLLIFDPHGDYLGLFEKQKLFPKTKIQILYPRIRVRRENSDIVGDLIRKMGRQLTEAQQQCYQMLLAGNDPLANEPATTFIQRLIQHADSILAKKRNSDKDKHSSPEFTKIGDPTINAVKRSLQFVLDNLEQMERTNERLRSQPRFKGYEFSEMPDPKDAPDEIVSPGLVSIFYLAGYDHLNQSAIVSIVLEALFAHRSELSEIIPPFQTVIEEAHNFIPSRQEGTDETPSLVTIRKVITEGRKFGTGLVLISQRPSRLDETTLAQCNSFLVLRLVNPKDKSFVRSVMENLSEADANILQTFGPGQGLVSGQAVRFPLLVKVKFDEELVSTAIGDEDFITEARAWKPNPRRAANSRIMESRRPTPTKHPAPSAIKSSATRTPPPHRKKNQGRRHAIQPDF
jgi:DNA helicase HerA-like ATPase